MADPPFSTDDLDLPIDPNDYVNEIEGNFDKCRTEIKDLDSRLKSATGSGTFDPFLEQGQLEVNGNFRYHRRMQEVSRTTTIPVNGNVFTSPDYIPVSSGAGLGIAGAGIYRYHPTVCPGWYAPTELMPVDGGPAVNGFGDEPTSGGYGMQIDLPANPRLNGANDESVIFQPLSVHNPAERWAGRQIRAQIEFEHDAAIGLEPEIYAAWDVSGVRTFSHSSFSNPAAILPQTGIGTTSTLTFDFTPPAAATMLEIGIRFRDPAAHTFVFRRFIVSTNLGRSLALAHPGIAPAEYALIDAHYYRSVHGRNGVDFVPLTPVMPIGSTMEKHWSADDARPVIQAGQAISNGRWSGGNGATYAKPLIVTQEAPHSGALLMVATHAVTVAINEINCSQGGAGNANYQDWRATAYLDCEMVVGTVPAGNDFNPDWLVRYEGEWLTTFKPLLLP